jgi:DNA modification methylase
MINLYKGDCLIESDKIESGSVDLILTDLPYGVVKMKEKSGNYTKLNTAEKWDKAIEPKRIFEIANRILRKNGKMILFSQEPYTSRMTINAIPNVPFSYRMTWEKDNFANGLGVNKAPVSYFEDILVFSKSYDTECLHPLREYVEKLKKYTNYSFTYFLKMTGNQGFYHFMYSDKKNPQFDLCTEKTYLKLIEVFGIDKMNGFLDYTVLKQQDNEFKKKFASTFNLWEGNKYKSNILKYKKDYTGHHPTQKPILLLEDLIKTFSNENDLVVDLTMGSGSTGVACVNTNRNFIGIEMDDNYFQIAEQRIKDQHRKNEEELFRNL